MSYLIEEMIGEENFKNLVRVITARTRRRQVVFDDWALIAKILDGWSLAGGKVLFAAFDGTEVSAAPAGERRQPVWSKHKGWL